MASGTCKVTIVLPVRCEGTTGCPAEGLCRHDLLGPLCADSGHGSGADGVDLGPTLSVSAWCHGGDRTPDTGGCWRDATELSEEGLRKAPAVCGAMLMVLPRHVACACRSYTSVIETPLSADGQQRPGIGEKGKCPARP